MSASSIDPSCDGCEDKNALFFCDSCNAHYCDSCDVAAHSVKNTKNHERVRVNASHGANRGATRFCLNHAGRKLELFCKDCNIMICLLCRDYGIHKNHSSDIVGNVENNLREVLHEQIVKISQVTVTASETFAKVEKTIMELGYERRSGEIAATKSEINKYFNDLVVVLNQRRVQLQDDAQNAVEQKQSRLRDQAKTLEEFIANGSAVIEKAISTNQTDNFTICDLYLSICKDLNSVKCKVPILTGPCADADIPTAFDQSLHGLIGSYGIVGGPLRVRFTSAESGVCKIEWDEPASAGQNLCAFYKIKMRFISCPPTLNLSDKTNVLLFNGKYEIILATVPRTKSDLSVLVTSYPGALIEFLVQGVTLSGVSTAWAVSPQKLRVPEQFLALKCLDINDRPFGSNGLFYWIGTKCGQSRYENPHISGAVKVTWSSYGGGSVEHFVDNDPGTDFNYTADEGHSWMAVSLNSDQLFRPNAYCLRHDIQGPRGVLRNWLLQARENEHVEWTTLSSHQNDHSLSPHAGSVASFALDSNILSGYKHFRILQTGRNSSDKLRLLCSGFELYGTLYEVPI